MTKVPSYRALRVPPELVPSVRAIRVEEVGEPAPTPSPYPVLPGPYPVLGLQTRGRLAILRGDISQPLGRVGITGLQTGPRQFQPSADARSVLILFQPHGLFSLLGQSLDALTDHHPELAALLGEPSAREFAERVAAAATDRQIVTAVSESLLAWQRRSRFAAAPTLVHAVHQIVAQHGNVRTERLSATLGLSSRQLERQFKEQVGVGPKRFASLVRFDAALANLAERHRSLDLALGLGFFDQAHFIREFGRYAGTTPSAYGRSHPNFPDLPHGHRDLHPVLRGDREYLR